MGASLSASLDGASTSAKTAEVRSPGVDYYDSIEAANIGANTTPDKYSYEQIDGQTLSARGIVWFYK